MLRIRKRSFAVTLALAAAGMPALGHPLVPAHGATGPPPVIGVAILPERARVRRRLRSASLRVIRWRALRRHRQALTTFGAHRQSLHSRLPLRESYARGPPRGARSCLLKPSGVKPPGYRQAVSGT